MSSVQRFTSGKTAYCIQRAEDEKLPNLWGRSKTAPLLVPKEESKRRRLIEGEETPDVIGDYQLRLMGISALGQLDLPTGPIPGAFDNSEMIRMFNLDGQEVFALEAYGSPFKDKKDYKYYMGPSAVWGKHMNGWSALTSALGKLPSFESLNLDLPLFRVEREESTLFKELRKLNHLGQRVYIIHGIHTMQFGQKHLLSTSLMVSSHSRNKDAYRRGFYCYKSKSARFMNNFSSQGMVDGGEALLLPGLVTLFTGLTQRKWQGEMIDCAELVEVEKGKLDKGVRAIDDFNCADITDWATKEGYYKNCFLTTACTASRGLPDDCEELTVLREFRDNYLNETPDGRKLIARYYRIAPLIVASINQQPDAQAVFDRIYDVIGECVMAVKTRHYDEAVQLYYRMVDGLEREYLR